LEYAFNAANLETDASLDGVSEVFEGMARKASAAKKALEELLRKLEPLLEVPGDAAPLPTAVAKLAVPLGSSRYRLIEDWSIRDSRSWRRLFTEDATAILRTREILAGMTRNFPKAATRSRRGPGGQAETGKASFTIPFAELWVHLTGRGPSKAHSGPFLDLTDAAWSDAFGAGKEERPHMLGALRVSLKVLTQSRLDVLLKNGPEFLKGL
jgi:hypothetical protein